MKDKDRGLFVYLPLIALFGYWLYACVICAFLTLDPRMLKIAFVSLPVVLGMALGALKLARSAGR